MCAAHAEREEAASAIASARAASAAEDDEDDLDSVDADEDAEYEAFLEGLYSPSESDWQVKEFSLVFFLECLCY